MREYGILCDVVLEILDREIMSERLRAVDTGVAIAQRAVEARHARLDVRDLPDIGCIFTIDLPRASPRQLGQRDTRCEPNRSS